VRSTPNLLLIVLDALREDAVPASLGADRRRSIRARTCLASAPWTLPSCSSLLTGNAATRHGHYWITNPLPTNALLGALPERYRRVGIVNNPVLSARSGLGEGFHQWKFHADHLAPFERALELIPTATSRKPLFVVLHSNIPHDYYLDVAAPYYEEAYPEDPGPPFVLGERVITWRDTDTAEREAVTRTYRACVQKTFALLDAVLGAVRERDDFVTAVTADHGEGFEPEIGRVHHAGRVHQDLIRVPLFFDLPSAVARRRHAELADTLDTHPVSSTDILPTMLMLAGQTSLPETDGVPVTAAPSGRVLVSEDRRYLYLKDRFRFNFHGRFKNMTDDEIARNQAMQADLGAPPVLRSFVADGHKLIVTSLALAANGHAPGRPALDSYAARLLGGPSVAYHGDRLYACEYYDLARDPGEHENLLSSTTTWPDVLRAAWPSAPPTVPATDGTETDLYTILAESELVAVS